jgi:hypothetical protein
VAFRSRSDHQKVLFGPGIEEPLQAFPERSIVFGFKCSHNAICAGKQPMQRGYQEIMKQKQVYDDRCTRKPDPPGQMLAGKRLKHAKMNGANLRSAMLAGADLREADLQGANLTGAMLFGANLSDAVLVDAIFKNAMLLGTQLKNARIEGANFQNSAFLTQDQIEEACGTPKVLLTS